jgi:hypothetical protein
LSSGISGDKFRFLAVVLFNVMSYYWAGVATSFAAVTCVFVGRPDIFCPCVCIHRAASTFGSFQIVQALFDN